MNEKETPDIPLQRWLWCRVLLLRAWHSPSILLIKSETWETLSNPEPGLGVVPLTQCFNFTHVSAQLLSPSYHSSYLDYCNGPSEVSRVYSCLPRQPERSCKTWINHNTPIFKIFQWLSILLEMKEILSIALFSKLILHLLPATHRTGFCFLKLYVLPLHKTLAYAVLFPTLYLISSSSSVSQPNYDFFKEASSRLLFFQYMILPCSQQTNQQTKKQIFHSIWFIKCNSNYFWDITLCPALCNSSKRLSLLWSFNIFMF